jgi:hypothetical protein
VLTAKAVKRLLIQLQELDLFKAQVRAVGAAAGWRQSGWGEQQQRLLSSAGQPLNPQFGVPHVHTDRPSPSPRLPLSLQWFNNYCSENRPTDGNKVGR